MVFRCPHGSRRWQGFCDQFAEIRRFDLLEASGPIFRWVAPRIRARADETANRFTVAEVDRVHRDDKIDNARNCARRAGLPSGVGVRYDRNRR